jgi:hypothetical protein
MADKGGIGIVANKIEIPFLSCFFLIFEFLPSFWLGVDISEVQHRNGGIV